MDTAFHKSRGFNLVEMAIVLALIGILVMAAIPSQVGRVVRGQITETFALADVAKEPIAAAWKLTETFPKNNEEAGLPEATKLVSNYVSRMDVEDGAIHLTFGNKAHGSIAGQVLSLRPAVVPGEKLVPVAWICGKAEVPLQMTVHGEDRTNIKSELLPLA